MQFRTHQLPEESIAAVREVNLYDIDDPLFRAHLARIAKARRPGASNPLARAYQVALPRWEGAVRRNVAEMAGFLDSKSRDTWLLAVLKGWPLAPKVPRV